MLSHKEKPGWIDGTFKSIILAERLSGRINPRTGYYGILGGDGRGNLDSARKYATQETQHLVTKQQNLDDATLKTGAVLIDGSNATVATIMTLKKPESNKILSFDTVLLKENDLWKVDYQRTLNNLLNLPFGELFKSLQAIGDAINKELEQQIPLFEKQIKSFSEELIRQLDEFRRNLEKSIPPEKQKPHSETI